MFVALVLALASCSDPVVTVAPPDTCDARRVPGCAVLVPAATVTLGAQSTAPQADGFDPDAGPEEGPPRRVTVPAFRLHRAEVTRADWLACEAEDACRRDQVVVAAEASGLDALDERSAQLPMGGVTWAGAAGWCRWRGGSLPSADQWERAARGPSSLRFPWGDHPHCGRPVNGRRTPPPDACEPAIRALDAGDPVLEDEAGRVLLGLPAERLASICREIAALPEDTRAREVRRRVAAVIAERPPLKCAFDGAVPASDQLAGTAHELLGMGGGVWEWLAEPETDGRRQIRGGGWQSPDPLDRRSSARSSLPAGRSLLDLGFRCVFEPR